MARDDVQAPRSGAADHLFLFDAADAVTRWFWPPSERRWFLIGGCLFWLFVLTIAWIWYVPKVIIYSAVIMALVLAQGIVLAGYGCEDAGRWIRRQVRR